MKFWYPFYFLYMCVVAVPLLIVSTIITSVLTLILSPLFPNNMISYTPAIIWAKFVCYVFLVRVKINGLDNISNKQSYIFTSNHQSMFDILVVYGWLPFIFKWVMKMELRKVPFLGAACASAGHIFIDRSNPIAAKKSMTNASMQLINGNSVVIFPEGTRTKTGKVGKFKRGAFLLAMELKLPIVPITLSGSYDRLPPNSIFIKPGKITMQIHPPIDSTRYKMEESSVLLRQTQEIVKSGLNQ